MSSREPYGRALLGLALYALLARGALLAADEATEKEIAAALASPDSHLRHETWKNLNPEKDAHFKYALRILKAMSWHDRDGAIFALVKAATEETLKKMVKELKESKDPMIRQGMAGALAKMNDEKFYPHLYEALKDKNPFVRRFVVHSLRVHKKKEAVEALINAFQTEDDPVVRSFTVEALNSLTQAFQGPNPVAWNVWWQQAKADKAFELGKVDEETKLKAEELGHKLKKRVTVSMAGDVTLETEERGSSGAASVPILVLPDYGDSKEVMKPFLAELEKTNKLFYIDLPEIKKFKNLKGATARNIPFYPIDKLVAAFEDLRKATGQERFALMASGMNCWIAMRYASRFPQSISHLVLINPYSSNKIFSDALDRLEREGKAKNDVELWHFAIAHSYTQEGERQHDVYHREKKVPQPPGEDQALHRRGWSLSFRDDRDSLASMLYPIKDRPVGECLVPEFRCFAEKTGNTPTIVIHGKGDWIGTLDDCKAIAKHFGGPRGQYYEYPSSSQMPFAEESVLFNKHMALLLREKPPGGAKKKAKKEKEEPAPEKTAATKAKADDAGAAKTENPAKDAKKDSKKS